MPQRFPVRDPKTGGTLSVALPSARARGSPIPVHFLAFSSTCVPFLASVLHIRSCPLWGRQYERHGPGRGFLQHDMVVVTWSQYVVHHLWHLQQHRLRPINVHFRTAFNITRNSSYFTTTTCRHHLQTGSSLGVIERVNKGPSLRCNSSQRRLTRVNLLSNRKGVCHDNIQWYSTS